PLADQDGRALDAISSVVRQPAELVQEISLASKQQVRGTEGVAHAMQIISGITRQTSQGTRGTVATVSQLVKLSDQLNEALSQFRAASKAGASASMESERPVPACAPCGRQRRIIRRCSNGCSPRRPRSFGTRACTRRSKSAFCPSCT